jgi:hypothetical protein
MQFPHDPNRQERIERLRDELKKLGGYQIPLADMPADIEEEYLRHILQYETAEPITLLRVLENLGVEVPLPNLLDDSTLTTKLEEVIERLASVNVFLLHTNHLSDRELYEFLYRDGLREQVVLFPENPHDVYVIDLIGSGSDENKQLYLKYYANEKDRLKWHHDWPADPLPKHEDPPFNRDRFLPKSPL